jgi:hypothetical protein
MQITAPSFSNQLQSCQEYIQLPPPSIKLSNKPISDSTLELPPLRNIVRNKRLKTNDMEGEAVAAMIQLSQFSEKK